jgi:uncharacterized protein YmfQ (DUF2313 family)
LPDYYRDSAEVVELQGAFEHWTDALDAARDDLFAQLNVETATWGLRQWETALGLTTDVGKSYPFRRTRVLSKLRGFGTSTPAMIQNVAESFSNGDVAILEYNAESRFEVKFVGTIGIPPNMDDLTAALDEIKPAHLSYTYIYIYRTHAELAAYTHAQLAAWTHGTLREGALK